MIVTANLLAHALSDRVPAMTAHDHADNLAAALRCHLTASCVQQVSVNRVNQIALAQRFPVQSVSRIEHYLSGVGGSGRTLSRTQDDFHQRFPCSPILR